MRLGAKILRGVGRHTMIRRANSNTWFTKGLNMDRRSLLKAAVVLPAAAAVPVASIPDAVADVISEPPAPVASIASIKANPYVNYVWQWFVSNDGETYYEGFETKEAAIEYAKQSEYCLIAECVQQDFRLSIDGYWLLEQLNDNNMELTGEGEGIECTPAQERDLEHMVQKAIEAWVVKHNISITAWSFDGVRNKESVEPAFSIG